VSLAELFAGDGPVRLTGTDATVGLAELRESLSGKPVEAVDPGGARLMAVMDLGVAIEVEEMFLAGGVDPPDHVKAGVRENPLVQRVRQSMLEADYRVVRSLGLDDDEAPILMARLWGSSFTAKRDRDAGPDASPQKRGRISRGLKAQLQELQEAINHGDD